MKFSTLVDYLAQLEATSKRLEMTRILGELFKHADADDIAAIVYLTQERLAPNYEAIEFGMGEALIAQAVTLATGVPLADVKKLYKERGDYGNVAEELSRAKSKKLQVDQVFEKLREIATTSGEGTVEKRVNLLADMLKACSPREARYLLRVPMGRLRLGVGDVTVLDGLSWSETGDKSLRPDLERAYNITSDLGLVAETFKRSGFKGLSKLKIAVGRPIRMELAERAKSAQEIIDRMGECALEPKVDGFRVQAHKDGEKVRLFSRNLEETTEMFPDVADAVRAQLEAKRAIIEGEAIAFDPETGDFRPFQETIQRKRKYGIDEMKETLPLKLLAFDVLWIDGEDVTGVGYKERHERLGELIAEGPGIQLIEQIYVNEPKAIDEFFMTKVEAGLEGIMAKRLDSKYVAGARNFNWMKFKRAYQGHLRDTMDLVVVGYLRGRGQRARFGIGALLCAVYDKKNDRFRTVAKVGSGLTEMEWLEYRNKLDAIALDHPHARVDSKMTPDVWVEPKYVMEVQADEITRSPIHTAGAKGDDPGYALRFPRVTNPNRIDKSPEDATTEHEIISMFEKQSRSEVKG
ncbi:MAG: ATP-dependent DNA ligase [Anaerolineae bacterium]|nr:ATP-dependent DNA ligase [Anaerolineae bacterium]